MKKGFLFTMFAALVLTFAACNPDDDDRGNGGNNGGDNNNYSTLLVGTWLVDNLTVDGEDMTPQNMHLTFYDNGRGLMEDGGPDENNDFGWVITGNTITVTPHHGQFTFTITSLTSTECSFNGNYMEMDGHEINGDIRFHMTKVNGGDPNPPDPANFPSGTQWQFLYDSTFSYEGFPIDINMVFWLDFVNAINCDLSMQYSVSAMGMPMGDTTMTVPMSYTYNSSATEGIFTIVDPDSGESETLPFDYNATDNTIIIDVPAEFFQDDEGGDEGDDDFNLQMPTHWVFQRIN